MRVVLAGIEMKERNKRGLSPIYRDFDGSYQSRRENVTTPYCIQVNIIIFTLHTHYMTCILLALGVRPFHPHDAELGSRCLLSARMELAIDECTRTSQMAGIFFPVGSLLA